MFRGFRVKGLGTVAQIFVVMMAIGVRVRKT